MTSDREERADGAVRVSCELRGIVQGVGLRPALFRLAAQHGVGGEILNLTDRVRLTVEGAPGAVEAFLAGLPAALPAPAQLDALEITGRDVLPGPARDGFAIAASDTEGERAVVIPADLRLCDACRRELFDPADRRHGYPFTTCTLCGPRYTVVRAMPYDRERTTLAAFPLCPACRAEYTDPHDRRFHAESVACPACGPRAWLEDADGRVLPGDPLAAARRLLAGGGSLAVRGIGGFLLAVDAAQPEAIARLRARKRRPDKPLAVMARDMEVVRRVAAIPAGAEALLDSPEGPIVILETLPAADTVGAVGALSPDGATLGILLPTSPLHELLLTPLPGDPTPPFDLLVMTSGNRRGEPICLSAAEARARLAGIADAFLMHNREIELRADDSIAAWRLGAPQLWRRARGYAPRPLRLHRSLPGCTLACGADMKNALAVLRGDRLVLSPHIGDLDTPEALAGWRQAARAFPDYLGLTPTAVAVDRHPDMQATRMGEEAARRLGVPCRPVQHHAAHAAACLWEHGYADGLVLVFDGTGLGEDGAVWGAELLELADGTCRRLATFEAVPLPGGDAAVREPARQLVARWAHAGREPDAAACARFGIDPADAAAWAAQCRAGLNAPRTHAAGRLFDAWAAAIGIAPPTATYDGQPAIRVEMLARRAAPGAALPRVTWQPQRRDELLTIDWSAAFLAVLEDPAPWRRDPAAAALALHRAVSEAALHMARDGMERTGRRVVGLSGGVFMNRLLTEGVAAGLADCGATALVHRRLPPGDGCIAAGQAILAAQAPGCR